MNRDEFDQFLKKYNACPEGYAFVKGYTLEEAIEKLDRQDWLMWVIGRLGLKKEVYVRLAIACAECIEQKEVGLKAIQAAKDWLLNPCEETAAAAAIASGAASASAAAYAAYTAHAAEDAAHAAEDAYAVYAAHAAEDASASAAYASYAAHAAEDASAHATYATYAAHAVTKKRIISEIKRIYKESLQ